MRAVTVSVPTVSVVTVAVVAIKAVIVAVAAVSAVIVATVAVSAPTTSVDKAVPVTQAILDPVDAKSSPFAPA